MASSVSIYTPFSTRNLITYNKIKRNSRKPKPKKITPNPNPLHKSQRFPSLSSGDATTYTRLPPKDDFVVSPSQSLSAEVKISDLNSFAGISIQERENSRKKSGGDEKLGFDYGKFQLFDVDSDDDNDDEDNSVSSEMNISNLNSFANVSLQKREKTERISGGDEELEFENDKFELFEVNSDDDEEEDFDGEEVVLGFGDGEWAGDEFEGGEAEVEVKEKGVPAVMRCFDRAKIYVKAGDGGNGVVAIRREKFVPLGGPSGGDGGRGGHVYVEVDGSMNSLLPFRQSIHYRAGRGSHGKGSNMHGAKGESVVVKVPPGTVVREANMNGEEGEVLLELLHPGQRALLLPGGRGGRGNAAFKTGMNRVPKIAENGEAGAEMWLELELKLVADVGIIGVPNAGKSTLLSVVSAAKPNIANYPFTTLLPNLGVVSFDYDATMVVADLPGLLEGAHRGFGLGHEFLRHTERCSVLVHIVDGSSQQPEYEYDAVRLELELFNPELCEKPSIVAYNKMDLPDAYENWSTFKERLRTRGIEPFCMSAATGEGTREVIYAAYELVQKRKEATKGEGSSGPLNLNHVADTVSKQRTAPINNFEISHDTSSNTWHVVGSGLQRFVQMTNWSYVDSDRRFQHVLEACGVFKSLTRLGVKEGDTVIIGEMEMVWHDYKNGGSSNMKRRSASIRWPQ